MVGRDSNMRREVVGLLPAAGHATRMAPLPCSKELYPIGFRPVNEGRERRPKVACHYLLEEMRAAGITKAYVVIREGKWDIPAYLRDGGILEMDLAYLVVQGSLGVPYSLDEAYPFVGDVAVAFGFPDILFNGEFAFKQLLSHQAENEADILLGLFPGDQPDNMDMVDVDENRRVREIVIKPQSTELRYSWDIALWTPAFTEFLHSHLASSDLATTASELSVGHVIQAAIRAGLRVQGLPVSEEPYLDVGTPAGLARAIRRFGAEAL
jgi:glucose-1-phosphate thymidylyltransferase